MEKYILITGGELCNKGAQAMTFITINEVAKRWPEYSSVVVSSMDYKRPEEEKENYKFTVIPNLNWKKKLLLHVPFINKAILRNDLEAAKYFNIIKNTVAVIDISGYALGTAWGNKNVCIGIVSKLGEAKWYSIPFYFLSQSFGPFDYNARFGHVAKLLLKKYMPYASVIMAREKEGLHILSDELCLTNVVKTSDLVLQNKNYELKSIFYKNPDYVSDWSKVLNDRKVVAIIPNSNTLNYCTVNFVYELYNELIKFILENGIRIALVYHSTEDLKICQKIKADYFRCEEDVIVIEQELSCIEFDSFVENLEFVIASRYHAIVHSFKKAVPAISIGWATKYKELMEQFHQEDKHFDVRNLIDIDKIKHIIMELINDRECASSEIKKVLQCVQKENIYDYIQLR